MDIQSEPSREQAAGLRPRHPTGLAALLFTDIVDSTALMQRLGNQAGATLIQRHHELVRKTLAESGNGEEIETAGDSFLLVFAKPSEAVRFSLLLQSRIRQSLQEQGVAVQDRIGIHLGEIVIEEKDADTKLKSLYGVEVDTCARVMSLAQGGQILMTRSVFDNARQALRGEEIKGSKELKWLNHGPYLLKGLEDPIEVCEVGEAEGFPLTPPPTTQKAQRYVSADSEPVLGWRPALEQRVPGSRWTLEEKLGEGGFGEVWAARHETLKEKRVFKFCFRAERVRSLKREVTLFRLLKERIGEHPNIVRLHDVYFDEPPYYLMEEYVPGKDLATWCKEQGGVEKIPAETRLEIAAQVADALQAAHEAGVIHRDVKPGNILINRWGETPSSLGVLSTASKQSGFARPLAPPVGVKLSDFGIGQVLSEEYLAGLTRAGFTKTMVLASSSSQTGTQMYMAPELLAGRPASTRSDIYSLGVVLYQLLVGDLKHPLTTDWARKVSDPLLREDLEKCFAGDPQERFVGAGQLGCQLRALPERRVALAKQQAELAARERVAYRKGVFRTSIVAVFLVGAFAALGVYALQQAANARHSAEKEGQQRALAQRAYEQAADTLSQMKMQRAEEMFAADDSSAGLANLARFLRDNPTNRVAIGRLLSALSYRNFALPIYGPLKHEGRVTSAQFNRDGRWIVTASADKTARIWDVRSGRPLIEPLMHGDGVTSASFSSDGHRLVTACSDGTAGVWDTRTGQPLTKLLKHEADVNSAQFSPDGSRIVTASADNSARVWDARTGQPLTEPLRHADSVNSAQFNSDGDKVITASVDETARIWDARTGQPQIKPLQHKSAVPFAQFSPDGRRVVTASADRTARVWDARTGLPLTEPLKHDAEVTSARFSADGNFIVSSSLDKTARVWDTRTGDPVGEPLRHKAGVLYAEFSPQAQRVITASLDKTARVWDARTGRPVTEPLRHAAEVTSAQFGPDGEQAITLAGDAAFVWDVRPSRFLPVTLKHGGMINSAEFNPDGSSVVTASDDKAARTWDAKNGLPLSEPFTHDTAVSLAQFSADGRLLVTASGDVARIWDARTGRLINDKLKHRGRIWSAQFCPDGQRVVTASGDKTAIVWDARTGEPLLDPLKHEAVVWSVCFDPSGTKVATASADKTARVWEARSGRALSPPLKHEGSVRSIQFSPDGLRVLTASADKTARIWDAHTGAPLGATLKHESEVIYAQFSPSGTRVATASADKTARVWDARTGQPLTQPLRYEGPVWSVQFSSDEQWIVAASADKTARIWDARTGQPLTEPLKHDSEVQTARFSPNGRWVLTVSGNKAYLWEMPYAASAFPGWAADLAEAVGGIRFNDSGISEAVPKEALLKLRDEFPKSQAADTYSHWAKWFFADRTARAASPSSAETAQEHLKQRPR